MPGVKAPFEHDTFELLLNIPRERRSVRFDGVRGWPLEDGSKDRGFAAGVAGRCQGFGVVTGGKVLEVLHTRAGGGEQIAHAWVEIARRRPGTMMFLERMVNGRPGLVAQQDGVIVTVFAFEVVSDRTKRIWVVRNPEKLRCWSPRSRTGRNLAVEPHIDLVAGPLQNQRHTKLSTTGSRWTGHRRAWSPAPAAEAITQTAETDRGSSVSSEKTSPPTTLLPYGLHTPHSRK
ncbi:hypothetical protein [Amycolatopsis sp. WAC 01376]|uniref:hypothetical protein n=1 Tax=Amycolatopsis sp. WAC 01376 TaxID=2203195 RepID=UPI0018F6B919|nr:hypothetical protein [Amycolatopsis sp. WAC 01376]